MKVQTHSPRAVQARRTIVELLLANHPDDCLYCVRNRNCELQRLADELGVRQRRFAGEKSRYNLDMSGPSIVRDPAKCILCGKCVRVCEEVQGVAAIDFIGRGSQDQGRHGLRRRAERFQLHQLRPVHRGLPYRRAGRAEPDQGSAGRPERPEKVVVVQHAPAVSVTLGEEFGVPAGHRRGGRHDRRPAAAGLRPRLRHQLHRRPDDHGRGLGAGPPHQQRRPLPMFTSCSPGWIKFVETHRPDFIENLSTCKSPQQMMGAVIKSYFAEREGIDPAKIFSVSIMPCTAKKFEAGRPEMGADGMPDIDAVLTTRELAQLIRMRGLDLRECRPARPTRPSASGPRAGKLFGATGGVMEAAIRTAH